MANKYWENEEAIVTSTENAEIHYYKEAGKIQLYGTYEDKGGNRKLTRAVVWDNNNMSADEAVSLIVALMRSLLDVGVENVAFTDAYNLLCDDLGTDEELDDAETFDESFEDEENILEYSAMSVSELREICENLGLVIPKRVVKSKLVQMLQNNDSGYTSTGKATRAAFKKAIDGTLNESVSKEFKGKHLVYKDGKYKKANKRVDDIYIDWIDDCVAFIKTFNEYITKRDAILSNKVAKTPAQTGVQKRKLSKLKKDFLKTVTQWVETWEQNEVMDSVWDVINDLMDGSIDDETALIKFITITDSMDISY